MAKEIERKFLLKNDDWKNLVEKSSFYQQAYLANNKQCSVRVRIEDSKCHLNIKSATLSIVREEFDYEIPREDAQLIFKQLCSGNVIEKTRFFVPIKDHLWEIDVFSGLNSGLSIAEIELKDPNERFEKPVWLGEEVSDDPRYYNVYLIDHPYVSW